MNKLFLSFLLFMQMLALGQNNTPTFTWRMHLPYNSVRQIVEADKELFVLAELGIYKFHLVSGEVTLLTKVDGFSESEVSRLAYSTEHNTLVIAYRNGNVDLLKGNEIINVPGIKRTSIIGVKEIYDVKIFENRAYFATSFGVVVLDLLREEIIDDYQNLGQGGTALAVNSLSILHDSLYLATAEGLKSAPAYNTSVNLKNFASWSTNKTYDSAQLLSSYNNRLFFVVDSVLYTYTAGKFELAEAGAKKGYKSLVIAHNQLVICRWEGLATIDQNGAINERGEPFMSFATLDYQNNMWFGGFYRGLIKKSTIGELSFLKPQGPFASTSYDMYGQGDKMWVTSGGHTVAFGPTYNDRGYYIYEDGKWRNNDKDHLLGGSMSDFTTIWIDPESSDVWLGSFGSGLLKVVNEQPTQRFHKENSTIQSDFGNEGVAFGMGKDSKGNLWVSSFESDRALKVKRPDNTWDDFNVGIRRLGEMVVDEFDQIWMICPRSSGQGLLVAKEGVNGLVRKIINTSEQNGNLPNNNVKAIAIDKEGKIWVGTEEGLAVFYNPSLVFDGGVNANAQQIIIDDGNDVGFLLGNEVINDIKIDGGNRKWIATNNGAWLVKEDGSGVVKHFTTKNSPIPSDVVNCIGIVPNTGEVFFGTKDGIASTRCDATEAGDVHKNTLVFPNPVHPTYDGPITITGLPENATVKIVDVAGRVVYELISTGGTAVWDGKNFNGEKPKSGVYLIFSANEEDEDSLVSKLLIVR